jgi:hypothetical protein
MDISHSWLPKKGESELDLTMAKLKLTVSGKNLTEFVDEYGERCAHLAIPVYFLAEWIAENWWPLLWEPRKTEELPDDAAFLARHSILAAQHGFVLPRVIFVPTGRTIDISATGRTVPHAHVKFRTSAHASPLREAVEEKLRAFVDAVYRRLDPHLKHTGLQQAWQLVLDVDEEEVQFCEFSGALGLSPHEVNNQIADLLDKLLPKLGERLLMDLCLVSRPNNFETVAGTAGLAFDRLNRVEPAILDSLFSVSAPPDNFSTQAWQRGARGAKMLRKYFGIEDTNPSGATQIFERLKINTHIDGGFNPESSLTGVVTRHDVEARLVLLQPELPQRRFAAARALFAAWSSEQQESRFLTSAVTRDQQANRAFAAELTAPFALLRSRARRSKLSQNQVFDLAAELQIGSDVVEKQAVNNGLDVRPIYPKLPK